MQEVNQFIPTAKNSNGNFELVQCFYSLLVRILSDDFPRKMDTQQKASLLSVILYHSLTWKSFNYFVNRRLCHCTALL